MYNQVMKRSIELIDQLIVMAEKQDGAWKEIHQKMNKSTQTLGEGSIVFHLKALRELIVEESIVKPVMGSESLWEELAKRHIALPMFAFTATGDHDSKTVFNPSKNYSFGESVEGTSDPTNPVKFYQYSD